MQFETLLEVFENHNNEVPDKNAFTYFNNTPYTYKYLWSQINSFASFLIKNRIKNKELVIISIGNSEEFFSAFYGVQRAGGIAVPVFPESGVDRIIGLAKFCNSNKIIISEKYSEEKKILLKEREFFKSIIEIEKTLNTKPQEIYPIVESEDIAFIQFTSGSSGNPKGVQISHSNIITNIKQMIVGMKITKKDSFVSWLPVYHDMGLILMTMVPFYLALDLTLLPTGLIYFRTWLEIIEEKKATFTAAPDFAYRYCLIFIKNSQEYNLSSLRVALNAAEPIRSTTIKNFEKNYNLKNVLLPAYGLAEATVGVSCSTPGTKIITDKRGFVSVGKPFPKIEISIWNNDIKLEHSEQGEIRIKSPANTTGYLNNTESTKNLFDKEMNIKTGDIGYLDEFGNCFIIGREKNIIIHGGINIASREIEEVIEEYPFIRRSAAIGIDNGSIAGEQVYIFIELKLSKNKLKTTDFFEEINNKVINKFYNSFGFRPGRVYQLKLNTIPMTYNGKIKYFQLQELYKNGNLRNNNSILYPDY